MAASTARKTAVVRRKTNILSDGTYRFEDRLGIKGAVTAEVITGPTWLLELIELEKGNLVFLSGTTTVSPRCRRFWIFYPAFTMSRLSFRDVTGMVTGKAGNELLPARFRGGPFTFESEADIDSETVGTILASASHCQSIEVNPQASSLSRKARERIAQSYASDPSIARIAAQLGVTNAHLSRQFRRDYAMTPRNYLHQLRLADATSGLVKGKSIADVSWNAGYGDLSRFYAQFRKSTRTSPGVCRKTLAPGCG